MIENIIFTYLFDSKVLDRGYELYLDHKARNIHKNHNSYYGEVIGQSDVYQVTATIQNGNIVDLKCGCLFYKSNQEPCKHLAAFFYALTEDEILSEVVETDLSKEEMIDSLNKKQLKEMLLYFLSKEENQLYYSERYINYFLEREIKEKIFKAKEKEACLDVINSIRKLIECHHFKIAFDSLMLMFNTILEFNDELFYTQYIQLLNDLFEISIDKEQMYLQLKEKSLLDNKFSIYLFDFFFKKYPHNAIEIFNSLKKMIDVHSDNYEEYLRLFIEQACIYNLDEEYLYSYLLLHLDSSSVIAYLINTTYLNKNFEVLKPHLEKLLYKEDFSSKIELAKEFEKYYLVQYEKDSINIKTLKKHLLYELFDLEIDDLFTLKNLGNICNEIEFNEYLKSLRMEKRFAILLKYYKDNQDAESIIEILPSLKEKDKKFYAKYCYQKGFKNQILKFYFQEIKSLINSQANSLIIMDRIDDCLILSGEENMENIKKILEWIKSNNENEKLRKIIYNRYHQRKSL